ncbi:MAG: hypothetical protein QXP70_06305 [Methanomassiliicoccales archaeon]
MRVRVLSRTGNPLSSIGSTREIPEEHLRLLNGLFFDGHVDLGGIVEVDDIRYICTKEGWRRTVD